tara:strand:- start:428 stop:625 length:198 start_codon:yes stop_codon:yes gene_type:complete
MADIVRDYYLEIYNFIKDNRDVSIEKLKEVYVDLDKEKIYQIIDMLEEEELVFWNSEDDILIVNY